MAQPMQGKDSDPEETREWIEALESVLANEGSERAHFLLESLIDHSRRSGIDIPFSATTAYVNTISTGQQAKSSGDAAMEWRLRSIIRWNATAMVMRANREHHGIGGHIASFGSSATLYDVGFNHFFHAPSEGHGGDLLYIQGHSAPGIYARAFLEGRLDENDLMRYRQEANAPGLSSYPHPWLMPQFWQFPTVSMGLPPIMGIYQARFMHYLHNRGIIDASKRKVWVFLGDGETDEPETLGAIGMAAREKLDNLIFVINCNLQRLDGPVRGNGKIIQELEGTFRGAGWNVIKLLWGSYWDPLLARDDKGLLRQRMEEAVDGEYQTYKAKGGAYTREHFFGKYPELKEMVAHMSDEDVWRLNRGGHDPHKIYSAYHAAASHEGQPTVILAKTVKGYGMGESGEGQNATHQQKEISEQALRAFRDRFQIPISDAELTTIPFYRPAEDSPEITYMKERRKELGGYLPQRRMKVKASLDIPDLSLFESVTKGSGERQISTTMAAVRLVTLLCRHKELAPRIVPIVPDEARTFGMEGMFRQLGIYAPSGQLYEPEDMGEIAHYREDVKGQILEEGITEAGAHCSWLAAATAYSNHGVQMIPFYFFYSMFGYQRVGDLVWASGDSRARGFLLGGTAGRTTLAGEGLQHQDGHSTLMYSQVPNCLVYDPCFSYELAVLMHDGLERMVHQQEDVFYYLTIMNENYEQPPMPDGVEEDIIRGMYHLSSHEAEGERVQLLGSGTILREVIAAAEMLARDFNIASDIWSVTSFTELRRDAQRTFHDRSYHSDQPVSPSYLELCLQRMTGPIIAASDYMQLFAHQIAPYVSGTFIALGTDGFGRSDTREALRDFFGVDRRHIVLSALLGLLEEGKCHENAVRQAIERYGINTDRVWPPLK